MFRSSPIFWFTDNPLAKYQTALIDIKQYSDVKLKKFFGRLRIMIALYQILGALGPIYGVRYPSGYTNVRCPPSSPPRSVRMTHDPLSRNALKHWRCILMNWVSPRSVVPHLPHSSSRVPRSSSSTSLPRFRWTAISSPTSTPNFFRRRFYPCL